ncbi:MAG TPA: hypothetical protein VF733_06835 [Candidatus Saccharimonadales bacterium]
MSEGYFERAIRETEGWIRENQDWCAAEKAMQELGIFLAAAIRILGRPLSADNNDRAIELPVDKEGLWTLMVTTDEQHRQEHPAEEAIDLFLLYEGEDDPNNGIAATELYLFKREGKWLTGQPDVDQSYDEIARISRFVVACVKNYEQQHGITAPLEQKGDA